MQFGACFYVQTCSLLVGNIVLISEVVEMLKEVMLNSIFLKFVFLGIIFDSEKCFEIYYVISKACQCNDSQQYKLFQ